MEATASFLTSPAVSCSRSSSSSSSSPTCYFPSISHLRIPYSRSSISIRKTHLFTPLSLHPTSPASSSSLRASSFHVVHNSSTTVAPEATATDDDNTTDVVMPKIDKSGRFCSPRAGRELALLITYASCLEGSDPIRLFEKRMNVRREPGYQFDKSSLLEYNPMIFGGPPVTTDSVEEADELLSRDNKESAIEAEVLSAPPKLVYSKLLLRFTRKLLVAVVDKWDSHVRVIDEIAPRNWKDEPASRILELCILHLAMSEITVIGTRHQIVINEAVDLAKRFCDGSAPRIINGCLRTFMKGLFEIDVPQASGADKDVL
ncbi:Transcription antitermination protein NusB [Linum perenne]